MKDKVVNIASDLTLEAIMDQILSPETKRIPADRKSLIRKISVNATKVKIKISKSNE